MPLVFQYGSNATAGRLNGRKRLAGRATVVGRAQTVDEFDISFDVYSQTNGCAASDLVETKGRWAWGILYEVAEGDLRGRRSDGRKTLAQIEGERYEEKTIRVRDQNGDEHDAVTFVVKVADRREGLATSAAYVSWIVYGLRDHGVPEDYLEHVIENAIATNERAIEMATEQIRLVGTL